jgi:hypothetical protein
MKETMRNRNRTSLSEKVSLMFHVSVIEPLDAGKDEGLGRETRRCAQATLGTAVLVPLGGVVRCGLRVLPTETEEIILNSRKSF